MRRRSRTRKRERKKLQRQQELQLPPKRTVSTAQLFELIESMAHVCRDAIADLETQSK